MRQVKKEDKRAMLLRALFAKSRDLGISADQLRDEIAPEVIKKRLSAASAPEIARLLDHITKPAPRGKGGGFKYPSSKHGLIRELEDAACDRWGEGWPLALNAFINANRTARTHYKFLNVSALKAVKDRIKELNSKEGK
jgi:hypothetical protein